MRIYLQGWLWLYGPILGSQMESQPNCKFPDVFYLKIMPRHLIVRSKHTLPHKKLLNLSSWSTSWIWVIKPSFTSTLLIKQPPKKYTKPSNSQHQDHSWSWFSKHILKMRQRYVILLVQILVPKSVPFNFFQTFILGYSTKLSPVGKGNSSAENLIIFFPPIKNHILSLFGH